MDVLPHRVERVPIVGREPDLALLDDALADAGRNRGGAVFLTGESGIGKTRLAAEAEARAAEAGMPVLRGRSSTVGRASAPFRPLAEALFSLLRTTGPPDDPELAPYRPVLAGFVPEWHEHAVAGGEVSLVLLAEAVLRLLAVVGRGSGCLLVLDDLHNADADTVAVVEYLADNLHREPVLLVATCRAQDSPGYRLALDAARRGTARMLAVPRLTDDQVRRLAAHHLATDRDAVPGAVVDLLCRDGDGNPFVVAELVEHLVVTGAVRATEGAWTVVGDLRPEVPVTVVRCVADRATSLGPDAVAVLRAAAVLGQRFPVLAAQRVAGLDDTSFAAGLRAATVAGLVGQDGPRCCAFRHALTVEALLADLLPAERADLALLAADAVQDAEPGLSGDRCQLVAGLRLAAGQVTAAATLFAEAGRRAMAVGAVTSSVDFLQHALDLAADAADDLRADIGEALLLALAEAGQVDRAFTLLAGLCHVAPARRAALHTRLAWATYLTGRVADGLAQVATARDLLGPDAAAADVAPVDAIAAHLVLQLPDPDRLEVAESLALRAADNTDSAVVTCQAMQILGLVARRRDHAESERHFEHMLEAATTHGLTLWRLRALAKLGANDILRNGDDHRLVAARQEATRLGAVPMMFGLDTTLAMLTVLRADHAAARTLLDAAAQWKIGVLPGYLPALNAVLAAHRGRRAEMERQLTAFDAETEEDSHLLPMVWGLARAFCSLLEEDRGGARAELRTAREHAEAAPTLYPQSSGVGVGLLLDVLDGAAGWPEHDEVAASCDAQLRWNRLFIAFARAVLLGRAARFDEAVATVTAAEVVAGPYPRAHHLGLRLVGEAALADGWGDPEAWLRRAEEHFHDAEVPSVAAACRSLLRRSGVRAPQRRHGRQLIPADLRRCGVTVREYEVLTLLVDRLGNRAIGERLYISPRTVEKHVASLITKTGQPDRAALCAHASAQVTRD
ncbi:AAA family ATPase [Solihabitans fulvus]|uniref:AAA family ATPase n=1 Tax=Solihabitans fulvus TaxID=1892852 RepID=A0A5B2X1Z7_9PSEU|nr:LuxR family transcriptional regulator [Solihabitans fulvus]KAA2257257.1 AAA family ATPase [Solihabitans fulvus]